MGRFQQRKLSIQQDKLHIQIFGATAVVEFYWDFEAKFKDGPQLKTSGRETQVLQKIDGNWRIVHVHYSSLPVTGERQGF